MSAAPRDALSRRNAVGITVAGTAGLTLPVVAADPATAAPDQGATVPTTVGHLTVNGRLDEPLGVDDTAPRLGRRVLTSQPRWRQTAYQVRAARTARDLAHGPYLWDSGKVRSSAQTDIPWHGRALDSRQEVSWRVRVWDGHDGATPWSRPASWETGLLRRADWGTAEWIEHPTRTTADPLPLFVRAFTAGRRGGAEVVKARLYLSGVGLHIARLNGRRVTDEVLAPGNSNYQLSTEYRVHDVTGLVRPGANVLGVELGHGTALVTRSVTNPATGRTAPYSWWQSQAKGSGTLAAPAAAGDSTVKVGTTTGYHVGGTINIDTGDGGERLESRTITAAGAAVTGSGNSLAGTDPSAGAAVTPRLIARLELTRADGTVEAVVSDRTWKTALGPVTTNNWYSGTDYDARREQPGWASPGADHGTTARRRDGSPTGWTAAGTAPPPNLTTELVWRAGEPVRVADRFRPVSVTEPEPGVWVFDFGQNFAGWPRLALTGRVAAGTTVTMRPAESLNPDGTVSQDSVMGGGSRGTDVFATYTTHGAAADETWHPELNYFGMQWVQVTGLPEGYTPTADTVTGLQLHADAPVAGSVRTSDARINRIHTMARYSVMSNMMSTFTDCPGREKLAYPADYLQPFHSLHRHFGYAAYLRTMERHLAEGQSKSGDTIGNVALKAPVYDWGYTGRFGDEINWGPTPPSTAPWRTTSGPRSTTPSTTTGSAATPAGGGRARTGRRRPPRRWRWTRAWSRTSTGPGSWTPWSNWSRATSPSAAAPTSAAAPSAWRPSSGPSWTAGATT